MVTLPFPVGSIDSGGRHAGPRGVQHFVVATRFRSRLLDAIALASVTQYAWAFQDGYVEAIVEAPYDVLDSISQQVTT